MTSNNFFRKTAIVSFAVVAIGAGSLASMGHSYAKESGEKGGTTDINIGVGELQECTISKSMDSAALKLVDGNFPSPGRQSDFEIQMKTSDLQNAETTNGGNVEFEWKVEEGES